MRLARLFDLPKPRKDAARRLVVAARAPARKPSKAPRSRDLNSRERANNSGLEIGPMIVALLLPQKMFHGLTMLGRLPRGLRFAALLFRRRIAFCVCV